jgi:CHC2 zinc finger
MDEADEHLDMEWEWKHSLHTPRDSEIIEMYAPSVSMLKEKMAEWEDERKIRNGEIKSALVQLYRTETNDFTRWFGERIIKLQLLPGIRECDKHIKRLRRLLSFLTPPTASGHKWEREIEKARQFSIYEIASEHLILKGYGEKFQALCPFHEEKHTSFYIYPKTNTFHCFGCQENGDIIKLTMHLNDATFQEAVKMLQ